MIEEPASTVSASTDPATFTAASNASGTPMLPEVGGPLGMAPLEFEAERVAAEDMNEKTIPFHTPRKESAAGLDLNGSKGSTAASSSGSYPSQDGGQQQHQQPVDQPAHTAAADGLGCNLFVSGLPPSIGDKECKALFEQAGRVLSARVMLNIRTTVSRGFGFVLFETREDATKAVEQLNGFAIDDTRTLSVSYSEHPGHNLLVRDTRLYIRNLPSYNNLPTAILLPFLQQFGTIVGVDSRTHRSDKMFASHPLPYPSMPEHGQRVDQFLPSTNNAADSLRVLFLEYSTEEEAQRCVDQCHNASPFPTCKNPLLSKIYEPAEMRSHRLKKEESEREEGKRQDLSRGGAKDSSTKGKNDQAKGAQQQQGKITKPHSNATKVAPPPNININPYQQQPSVVPFASQLPPTQVQMQTNAFGHPLPPQLAFHAGAPPVTMGPVGFAPAQPTQHIAPPPGLSTVSMQPVAQPMMQAVVSQPQPQPQPTILMQPPHVAPAPNLVYVQPTVPATQFQTQPASQPVYVMTPQQQPSQAPVVAAQLPSHQMVQYR